MARGRPRRWPRPSPYRASPNEVFEVWVRVIPVVVLPAGSFVARLNSIFASVASPFQTGGIVDLSELAAR